MNTAFILHFVSAVRNVFSTMAKTTIACGKPHVKKDGAPAFDVSGIIGFSGELTGAIILTLPTQVATELVARFSGSRMDVNHPDFADALGELVNMVAGSAKSQMDRLNVSISCPTVVLGKDYRVLQGRTQPIVVVPCQCDAGVFNTEIALRANEGAARNTEQQETQAA